jgi:integrase
VALESGLRKGELLGLVWDRVDMTRGVLKLEETKSGRRREVPMRQAVYDTLAALPGEHKGRVWPAGSIRTAFENAVTEAKLDAPFHFHDTRHHFASWYIMRGGSLPALQQILGHATLAMTMRYSHLSPKHLRDEMARTERAESTTARAQEALTAVEVSGNIA